MMVPLRRCLRKNFWRWVPLPAALPLALLSSSPGARAQTFVWQGGGGNNNWTTGGNWVGNTAPATNANAPLIFGNTAAPFPDMNANYSAISLTFNSSATAYSIRSSSGSVLTLGAGGITQSAGNTNQQSISVGGIVLGTSQTWNINSGGLQVTSPISGSSSAALTKTGTGTLTLLGNNTYSGGTTLSGGVINVGGDNGSGTLVSSSLGTGAVTLNFDTTINFNASSSAGSATITNNFGGSLNFNDTSSAGTATITNLGSLFFKGATTGGDSVTIANNGGSLNLSGPTSLAVGSLSGAGAVRLGSTELVVGALNRTETISGAISGAGVLTKMGTGTLTLTGDNSQTGGLQVKNGLLVLNAANSGGAGNVSVTAGNGDGSGGAGFSPTMTVSAINALAQVVGFSVTGGNGGRNQAGGNATLNVNAANQLANRSNVSVTGGEGQIGNGGNGGDATLNLATANALTNVGIVSLTGGVSSLRHLGGNATLNVSAANVIGNIGTIRLTGGEFPFFGSLVGGAAVLSLGANDTASSNSTHIILGSNTSVLTPAGMSSQARVDLNGYGLTIGGIDTEGVVNSSLIVQNGGSTDSVITVGTDNANYTFGGTLQDGTGTGTLSLVKVGSGTLTLANVNTYTGTTTLNGGTLLISSAAALGAQGNGFFFNSGTLGFVSGTNTLARNFALNGTDIAFTAVNANDTLTLTGTLSGSSNLNKLGAGTLLLTGTNSYSGATTIRSGTLVVNSTSALGTGVVNNSGTLVFNTNDNGAFIPTISGSGNLVKTGAGILTLEGNNTYSGGTRISSSTIVIGNDNALGTGGVILDGSTLQASGAARTLRNAITITAASALSTGTVSTTNAQIPGLILTGGVTLAGDGALTVTGNTRTSINSVVSEDSVGRTLIKDGTGTLVLTRDNTYTGGTFVRAGTLVVNNAYNRTALGSGTGEGAVTVGRGATLTGTFAISGALQVNNGGTLGIGNSIGHSSVTDLTLAGGSLLQFEIGEDGVSSDRLDIAHLLSKSGSSPITLLLSGEHLADGSLKNLSEGTFTLLTFGFASGVHTSDFLATGLPSDWSSNFVLTEANGGNGTPGTLAVTLSHINGMAVVPEPGSLPLLLVAGSMGTLLLARRGGQRKGVLGRCP